MRIFGICLIKNEADIIEYSLQEASKWAYRIFVYDNGSTDSTWEIVQELAKRNEAIVPFKSEAKPFRDALRGEVFRAYSHLAEEGDWWCCRLDSDEFYIDDPREVLKKISGLYHAVTSLHFEYKLTHEDVAEFEFADHMPEDFDKIKYYDKRVTSETRFFRHRKRLKWEENIGYPKRMGIIAPQKIRIKHLQFRSPKQIERRLQVRAQATREGYKHFVHYQVESWKDKLAYRKDLFKESATYTIGQLADPNKMPWYWYYFRLTMHFIGIYP